MASGWILSFALPSGTSTSERRRFERSFFGYTDSSNHGAYSYEREGFLSDKPHLIVRRGVLMIPLDLGIKTERFLRENGVSVWRRKIELSLTETKRLYPVSV